jgi:hypothetical protein
MGAWYRVACVYVCVCVWVSLCATTGTHILGVGLEQRGVDDERQDLTYEGKGLLLQALRVACTRTHIHTHTHR